MWRTGWHCNFLSKLATRNLLMYLKEKNCIKFGKQIFYFSKEGYLCLYKEMKMNKLHLNSNQKFRMKVTCKTLQNRKQLAELWSPWGFSVQETANLHREGKIGGKKPGGTEASSCVSLRLDWHRQVCKRMLDNVKCVQGRKPDIGDQAISESESKGGKFLIALECLLKCETVCITVSK